MKNTSDTNKKNTSVFRPFETISIMDPKQVAAADANTSSKSNFFEHSADFSRFFNSNGSPTSGFGHGSPFLLSKDSSYLPSMDEIFKSKDSFAGGIFASKEWSIDFTRRFSKPTTNDYNDGEDDMGAETKKMLASMAHVDVEDHSADADIINVAEPTTSDPSVYLKSSDWVGTLGSHVDLPTGAYTPSRMGWDTSPELRGVSFSSSLVDNANDKLPTDTKTAFISADWFKRELFTTMGIPRGSLGLLTYSNDSAQITTARLPPVPVAIVTTAVPANAKGLPVPLAEEASVPKAVVSKATKKLPKRRKRPPRKKIIPESKEYVEPKKDIDVLLGRGGRSNHFPGNKRYREEVSNLRQWYNDLNDKDRKTELSSCLVDFVKDYGGRFLELDREVNKWYIVPDIVARRKASQALREDNDPEKRRAKRQRYLAKKQRLADGTAGASATAATKSETQAVSIESG